MAISERRRLVYTAIAVALVGIITGILLGGLFSPASITVARTEKPGPARQVDVPYISRSVTDLPPPLKRTTPTRVEISLEAKELVAEIEDGTTYTYWTFNGQVPGPFFRVMVGDTVKVNFKNAASNPQNHDVDFHAVTGPGGGAVATRTPPGQETSFEFKALSPGLYIYHCAIPNVAWHIANGLYGLILVEPKGGLPPVDKEFYVMQGDFYTKWPAGTKGHQIFDTEAVKDEKPTYVLFNGRFHGLTGDHALKANVGETIRIYFGVGGPNLISSFHIIGEIFDRVYLMGDLISSPQQGIQTTLVPPGGAVVVDLKLEVPGDFVLVDHAISRAMDKGALGILKVSGLDNPEIYKGPREAPPDSSGKPVMGH
ncbi:MAG: copper-containing nitrite reductase [Chloroflexota bacterium]